MTLLTNLIHAVPNTTARRLCCAVLVMLLLLSCTACGFETNGGLETDGRETEPSQDPENKMVTVFIPEKKSYYTSNGELEYVKEIVYEEGWETKEHFTVSYFRGDSLDRTETYGNKRKAWESSGYHWELCYDDNGRSIFEITTSSDAEGVVFVDSCTVYTYDGYGRIHEIQVTFYYPDGKEPEVLKTCFQYTELNDGSEGVAANPEYESETLFYGYDEHFRLVRSGFYTEDSEIPSDCYELEYDAHGNLVEERYYFRGTLRSTTVITYKAVEISAEAAAQLPWLNTKEN